MLEGIFQGMEDSVDIEFGGVIAHESYSKNLR